MGTLLSGVKIIDLTGVIMGPFATRMLGDMGADIVKVEPPTGDSLRVHRPQLRPGLSAMFLNLNRNKRGIVLDLKTPLGRTALERLIAGADVILHNLRAPVMSRLGFDYERCRELKPDIIYCAAYGFGAEGPYASKPAYDDLIQAASGFASLATKVTGQPAYAPSVIFDKIAAQTIATSILAALFHRERSGEGQAVEIPMFEVAVDFNLVENFGGAALVEKGGVGYPRIQSPERRPFATADGYACILPYSDRNWRDFFEFAQRKDLLDDDRFRSMETRQDHLGELYAEVRQEAVKRTNAEWLAFCDGKDIPCMPVIELGEIFDDPHVKAVGLFEMADHPHGGTYRAIRPPVTFGRTPCHLQRHAPLLGEHTEEILSELGLSHGMAATPGADRGVSEP